MIVALIALVGVPTWFGVRVAEVRTRTAEVLEPAERLAAELRLLKARQFARMEGYLATWDPTTNEDERTFLDPYVSSLAEEDEVLDQLQELVVELDAVPPVIEGESFSDRLSALSAASVTWRLLNQQVSEFGVTDRTRAGVVDRYETIERLTAELESAIAVEVDASRRRVVNEQRRQATTTLALALLALAATAVVGRVGYRYRGLVIERETRRREAVQARREVDALLEATDDGVLGIDLVGRCTSLNRAGVRLLGFSEREIRGRDVHRTIMHSDPSGNPLDPADSELLAAVRAGEALESEPGAVLWRRREESFPARWSLQPLIDGVELRGAVLTFTDMTEIRDKEEALRRAVRQREDVVSIVSHDLRNPLGVALASADLLLDLPLDEAQRRRQAEIIRRSGKRMQRLIEDLLDVSRMEAGALVVRPSREEIAPILEEAWELFHPQAQEKGLKLVVTDAHDVSARLDRDRLLQGLANLLDNAIRLTPEGGTVTLSAETEGDDVAISVTDTGPGIEHELVETLFDRFAQGSETQRGSAGLGLTIVKGVASAHEGDVSVVSVPGEGSMFTIRIPEAGPSHAERSLDTTA